MQRGLWWTRGGGGHRRPLNHPLVGGHPQSDVLYRSTNARTPASPTPCIPPRYYPALKALGGQLPHRLASALLPGPAAPPSGAAAPGPPEHHKLGVMAVLLTSVPFGLAALASLALAHHSDHSRERVLHLALPFLVTGVVLAAFPAMVSASLGLGFVALTFGVIGVYAGAGIALSLLSELAAGPSLVAALPLYNSLGNIGGFVGPVMVGALVAQTRSFAMPTMLMGASLFLAGAMVLAMRCYDPRIGTLAMAERPRVGPEKSKTSGSSGSSSGGGSGPEQSSSGAGIGMVAMNGRS
ncbi:MAG: hypothetical protein WDW36_009932 [Sanguina aurantia]